MASALLIQQQSASLITIPKSRQAPAQVIPSQALSLPSRFPINAPIRTAVSPRGNIYLYTAEGSHVWEYDVRGKRLSEMSFGSNIERMLTVNDADGFIAVVLVSAADVRIMGKNANGKWEVQKVIPSPGGRITALASDKEAGVLAIGSDRGILAIHDLKSGCTSTHDISSHVTAIPSIISFAPDLPSTIVIPSPDSSSVILLNTTTSDLKLVRPFSGDCEAGITAISFSPVRKMANGEVKGGLCAVLRADSSAVGLIGLETPNRMAKIVDFGKEIKDVTFLGDAQLAAIAIDGNVLVKNLRSLGEEPVALQLGIGPVTGIRLLPNTVKISRTVQADSQSATASRRVTILGETRVNANTPPAASTKQINTTGEKKLSSRKNDPVVKPRVDQALRARTSRTVRTQDAATSPQPRVVSAPSPKKPRPSSSTSNLRAISNPMSPRTVPRPSSAGRLTAEPILEEEPTDNSSEEADQTVLNLSWALRPPLASDRSLTRAEEQEFDMGMKLEAMRREIGTLQLDMLRMGRDLKNEIRRAVEPLKFELKESRMIIERQRLEIERLKRSCAGM